jgi:hypothetical protein
MYWYSLGYAITMGRHGHLARRAISSATPAHHDKTPAMEDHFIDYF